MKGMIRLFGSRIYISVFAILLFVIIGFSYDAPFLYIALCSALFHELSHVFAMKLFGSEILAVSIYPFGADIRAKISQLTYRQEALVALLGPLASFVLFCIFLFLFIWLDNIYILSAAVSNFLFFAVNIFPVRGLDGARVLYALLMAKLDFPTGYKIFAYISTVAFGFLCAFALYLIYISRYNLSLVFICAYLFISEYTRQKLVD